MELTGLCEIAFEKWYLPKDNYYDGYNEFLLSEFYKLHPSMQYGVYVDFFDSVGISFDSINDRPTGNRFSKRFGYILKQHKKRPIIITGFLTRFEARTAAVKKADELVNNKTL